MSDRLLPCPACARHVRVSEATCPFCAATLPAMRAAQALPLPRSPGRRLSRAALFALGASAAATGACGGETTSAIYGAPAMVDDGGAERPPAPLYGGPPVDGGNRDDAGGGKDAGSDADAGADTDASDAAADPEGGLPGPLYGAPPP